MATKGYSFQDDEKTIIDIDIDMDIVVEREKSMNEKDLPVSCILENLKIQNWLNVFVGEK